MDRALFYLMIPVRVALILILGAVFIICVAAAILFESSEADA